MNKSFQMKYFSTRFFNIYLYPKKKKEKKTENNFPFIHDINEILRRLFNFLLE